MRWTTTECKATLTVFLRLSSSRSGRSRLNSLVWRTHTITATLTHHRIGAAAHRIISTHKVELMMVLRRHSFTWYREHIHESWCPNTRKRTCEWWRKREPTGICPRWTRRSPVLLTWWSLYPVPKRCICLRRSVDRLPLGHRHLTRMIIPHNLKRKGHSGWSITLARNHLLCPVHRRLLVGPRAGIRDRNPLVVLASFVIGLLPATISRLARTILIQLMKRLGLERSRRDLLLHFKTQQRTLWT